MFRKGVSLRWALVLYAGEFIEQQGKDIAKLDARQ